MEFLKTYPTQRAGVLHWKMGRTRYRRLLKQNVQIMERSLPDFDINDRFKENVEPSGLFGRVFSVVDATELEIEKPMQGETPSERWIFQKVWYSFKKRMWAIKYQVLVSVVSGRILDVSPSFPGKVHDKKMWDEWMEQFDHDFTHEKVLADKGYIGVPECLCPVKKPVGGELTEDEKLFNKVIGSVRVIVEQVIGRIKRFSILKHRYRGERSEHETIFRLCAKLANLSMQFSPVRSHASEFLFD